jgi:hypothetical protein
MSDPFDLDVEAWDEDELDAELAEAAWVSCPYCGEGVEVLVDPAGGEVQEYVEDCEVCCQPWQVRVSLGVDGAASVFVSTLDDG